MPSSSRTAPTHAEITAWLSRAVQAPSGDNSQPWRFRFEGEGLLLLNDTDADLTQYNFKQRGSLFAHGALIENLSLVAAEQGYQLECSLFPPVPRATARLKFVPAAPVASPLLAALSTRSTNRKPYGSRPLTEADRNALISAAATQPSVRVLFVDTARERDMIAWTLSVNEQLIMENQTLHDFLFSIIRWSPEEESSVPGLPVKTMELPPPVYILFRFVLNSWKRVRFLNQFGFSRFIRTQSAKTCRASAAFGAIAIPHETDADYVIAGRAFERLWLAASLRGISLQPVAALPYLAARVAQKAATAFSPEQQKMIGEAYDVISTTFGVGEHEVVPMLFRLGYGDPPSSAARKAPPVFLDA